MRLAIATSFVHIVRLLLPLLRRLSTDVIRMELVDMSVGRHELEGVRPEFLTGGQHIEIRCRSVEILDKHNGSKREEYSLLQSSTSHIRDDCGETAWYQGNGHMQQMTIEEPVHERSLCWHHVGVFLNLLRLSLCFGQWWTSILSRDFSLGEPLWMRWWIEFSGLFENPLFGGRAS